MTRTCRWHSNEPKTYERHARLLTNIRSGRQGKYTKYFLSERGEVPWQYELLDKDEE